MNNQAQTKRCLHVFILNFFATLILFSSNKVKSIGMVFLLTALFLSNSYAGWFSSTIYELAHKGKLESLVQKASEGVNLHEPDRKGDTALIYASWGGHIKVVEYLLKQGAEINHQDHAGQTALHLAITYGHSDIAKYLVSNGANVNLAKTNTGSTPLILAGMAEQFDIAKYLIEQEADKSATNKKGQDFSHFAGRLAAKGDEKWIALLPNGKNNKALLQFKSQLAETKTQKSTQIASSTQTSNAQCSKDEVLKMVNAGFGKEEINRFCQNQSPQTSFSSSSINQALMSKLRSERSISREFISHLKTEYNASSGLLVLHSPCKVLVQKNDKRISRENEKRRNKKSSGGFSWSEFTERSINNPFAKSLEYERNCNSMLSRASVIAKTISGVKSTDVLR